MSQCLSTKLSFCLTLFVITHVFHVFQMVFLGLLVTFLLYLSCLFPFWGITFHIYFARCENFNFHCNQRQMNVEHISLTCKCFIINSRYRIIFECFLWAYSIHSSPPPPHFLEMGEGRRVGEHTASHNQKPGKGTHALNFSWFNEVLNWLVNNPVLWTSCSRLVFNIILKWTSSLVAAV